MCTCKRETVCVVEAHVWRSEDKQEQFSLSSLGSRGGTPATRFSRQMLPPTSPSCPHWPEFWSSQGRDCRCALLQPWKCFGAVVVVATHVLVFFLEILLASLWGMESTNTDEYECINLLFKNIYFKCMNVLPACVMCSMWEPGILGDQKKELDLLEMKSQKGCELPFGCWECNQGPFSARGASVLNY